jgi:Asp-tRNA(Asn)/Glu-tRNA(Gln) amidotransferase A subunit family amidase
VDETLTEMSARRLAELIRAGTVSPVEVVEAHLERIVELDPVLHAFITVAAERALAEARSAQEKVARGEPLGPLHGVPIALKDEAWTKGMPATGGSLLFKKFVPSHHGTVSERLEQSGAILIGKTNLPEFAAWPRSKTRLVGECVNPWDLSRISGASSGGSAAAVAAGLVPVAIGSDGGGSIRIPSALCGVSGLFPTPGRVSCYGSFSYSPYGSLGPIARDALDLALVQQVLAGPDPRDAWASSDPAPDLQSAIDSGVDGLRIGWSRDFGRIPVDPRIADSAWSLLELAGGAGATVAELGSRLEHPWGDGSFFAERQAAIGEEEDPETEMDIPETDGEQSWMWKVFATGVPLTNTPEFQALCRRNHRLLTPPAQLTYAPGDKPVEMPATLTDGEALKAAITSLLSRFDVVCSPTMATVAPIAKPGWGTPYGDPYMGTNFTFIANVTGCPAASIPCGLVDSLPAGLQIIGRPGDEATVLTVCHALQSATAAFPRPAMLDSTS